MSDERCYSVRGHDGLTHALDSNGYCVCGMGRGLTTLDIRTLYGNWPVDCLDCLIKQCNVEREHFVTLHWGI